MVVLASLQCLPQLTAHTHAALRTRASPAEVREAVYQPSPFIGFGDFESRGASEVAECELLVLCSLVSLELTAQVGAHADGSQKAGLDRDAVVAILHRAPYAGMTVAIKALRALLQG